MTKENKRSNELEGVLVHGRKSWSALGLFLAELDKELAWHTGIQYRGHTLREQENGYLLILRGYKGTRPVVAFCGGGSLLNTYRELYWSLYKNLLVWRDDRYA